MDIYLELKKNLENEEFFTRVEIYYNFIEILNKSKKQEKSLIISKPEISCEEFSERVKIYFDFIQNFNRIRKKELSSTFYFF